MLTRFAERCGEAEWWRLRRCADQLSGWLLRNSVCNLYNGLIWCWKRSSDAASMRRVPALNFIISLFQKLKLFNDNRCCRSESGQSRTTAKLLRYDPKQPKSVSGCCCPLLVKSSCAM